MFFIGHFILEIIKISLLGSLYALVLLLLFKVIGYFQKESWFYSVTENNTRFWFSTGAVISFALFVFMFTHWGNHGLGDSARLPLRNGQSIKQSDGVWTTFTTKTYYQIRIYEFAADENYIYAHIDRSPTAKLPGKYVIWNLETDHLTFFKSEDEYTDFAKVDNLPLPNEFKEFDFHYDLYWGGWRFWLLP
ncbi:MAG: hypothetical protein R2759_13430 [Bacteroidales bacterium]